LDAKSSGSTITTAANELFSVITMDAKKLFELEKKYVMPTYTRHPIVLASGIKNYVLDSNGKRYLDFVGALATCPVGHNNPDVVAAIEAQAKKLINTTCLYYTEPQILLAQELAKLSGLSKTFFSNSGSEANEVAIKLARKHTQKKGIISTEHAFHGRTMGALSATHKERYKEYCKPLVPGFSFVPYGDAAALESAITDDTAAFIVEPIQGEAGVIMPPKGYLQEVRKTCDKHSVLLILDEVQTGVGRTGTFYCYEQEGILPDIVTLAKGLANGVPIGATTASDKVACAFDPGDQGSTFGGNALSCAAALATINYITKNKLMNNAKTTGEYFMKKLRQMPSKHVTEVRGKGLMIGAELNIPAKQIVEKCIANGLLVNNASDTVLRFLPPLITMKEDVDRAMEVLMEALS